MYELDLVIYHDFLFSTEQKDLVRDEQSGKQILWPKNATQISFQHRKHDISRVGNLDIPEYQDSPPTDCPLGGQS